MDMREAADLLLAATEARRVELGKRWKQIYQDAGLTHQTLNRWRHGHPVDPLTERALERALMWAPGARQTIAAGRDPLPLLDGVNSEPEELREVTSEGAPTARAEAFLALLKGEPPHVQEAVARGLQTGQEVSKQANNRHAM